MAHRRTSGASEAGRVLRGAAVVELAALLPFFGWFVVLPLAFAAGLGGAVIAIGDRARSASPAPRDLASLGAGRPSSAHTLDGGIDHVRG